MLYKCTPMNIGYCRVSTQDQNLELQLDELKKAGCEKIFQVLLKSLDLGGGVVDVFLIGKVFDDAVGNSHRLELPLGIVR